MARKKIPKDRLIELHNRFHLLPVRHKERKRLVMEFAEMYGVSSNTIYRSLRELFKPKSLKRSDTGNPRQIDGRKMEMYCQTITATQIHHLISDFNVKSID